MLIQFFWRDSRFPQEAIQTSQDPWPPLSKEEINKERKLTLSSSGASLPFTQAPLHLPLEILDPSLGEADLRLALPPPRLAAS